MISYLFLIFTGESREIMNWGQATDVRMLVSYASTDQKTFAINDIMSNKTISRTQLDTFVVIRRDITIALFHYIDRKFCLHGDVYCMSKKSWPNFYRSLLINWINTSCTPCNALKYDIKYYIFFKFTTI